MRAVRISPPLLAVAALGVLLRAVPLLMPGGLTGLQEYDDGVYYAASVALLHGQLPYAHQAFLQPPGIVLLLLPFAAFGTVAGPATGMAAARLAELMAAGVNTLLVASLAYRAGLADLGQRSPAGASSGPDREGYGRVAALLAASTYAVAGAAVVAAHTVLLEPILTLFVLLAARHLLPRTGGVTTRGVGAAGLLLAGGTAVKLWGLLALVAAACLLLMAGGFRPAFRLIFAYAGALVALLLPFAIAAPRGMVRDLVTAQLSRPQSGVVGVPARLSAITGWSGLRAVLPVLPAAGGWLAGLLLAAFLVHGALSQLPTVRLFGLQGALFLVAFLLAGSYFIHYGEVLVPSVAILLGLLAVRVGKAHSSDRRLPRAAVATALAGMLVLSAGFDAVSDSTGQPDVAELVARVVPPNACLFSDAPSATIAAGRLWNAGCPDVVDPRGTALVLADGHPPNDLYPAGFQHLRDWQVAARSRLAAATYALLLGAPESHVEWDAGTRAYFIAHYVRRAALGGPWRVELWQRVDRAYGPRSY
ncbi:MAG: hypothetical protein M3P23_09740 [Actinomycetota bacterium]|nr:hypothetical protein [Actinomycetota bacterium]